MGDPHGAAEGRRQACLAALGIPLWTSRGVLPGALPAAPLVFVAPASAPDAGPVPGAIPASAPATPAPEAAPSRPPRPERPPVQPLTAPAAAEGFPRFSCRVQVLAPGWLGVVALEEGAPDLSAQEYRLLGNLLLALGGDASAEGPREHFRWPMSPNPAIPRDAGAAREALAAFLARRGNGARWLVLGETLALYVRAALPGQTVVAAPLLRELLESPAAKRALWQGLHD